jgi:hypothetical protein
MFSCVKVEELWDFENFWRSCGVCEEKGSRNFNVIPFAIKDIRLEATLEGKFKVINRNMCYTLVPPILYSFINRIKYSKGVESLSLDCINYGRR